MAFEDDDRQTLSEPFPEETHAHEIARVLNENKVHAFSWYPHELTKKTPEVQILWLCHQFPWISRKVTFGPLHAWDADFLERASRPWSSGERQVALFILMVWSGQNWKGKGNQFDCAHAAGTVCRDDMKVITNWMQQPFWP